MTFKRITFLSATLLGASSYATLAYTVPYCATPTHITPRSQGEHIERINVGLSNYLTKTVTDTLYGTISLTPAYSRSFNPTALAALFFGDFLQSSRTITVAGLAADPAANGSTDIRAEWLYLPTTYRGSMRLTPRVQNFTTDIDLYLGMDKWFEGLFARVVIPVTHTSWDLGVCSVVEQRGSLTTNNVYYLGDQLDYWCCEKTLTGELSFPIDPLSYARICPCSDKKNGVADIHADLGWKMLVDDNFHFGFLLRTVIPTGTRNDGKLLFSHVIGNGHHWELGGGITSSFLMWSDEEREDRLGFYIDCYITHLFNNTECRVFDLKNKPLSRYMIATKVTANDGTLQQLTPLANLTASRVHVKINAQADLALWLDYTHKNMTIDLGYNFWARSCEKVSCASSCTKCSCCPNIISENKTSWGIWSYNNSATASNATIADLGSPDATPVLLSSSDLAFRAGATRGMSQSLFSHIAYNWFDKINVPYVGLGGSVEWARSGGCAPSSCCIDSCTKSCKSCCRQASLSQWSLWAKGGVAF